MMQRFGTKSLRGGSNRMRLPVHKELSMKTTILVSLAILTLSTSAALAAQRTEHVGAMKPKASAAAVSPKASAAAVKPKATAAAVKPKATAAAVKPKATAATKNRKAPAVALSPKQQGRAMNAYAAMGAPAPGMLPTSSKDHDMYMKNLHDSGYNPKGDFTKAGTLRQQ